MPQDSLDRDVMRTQAEAAAYLRIDLKTLRKYMRTEGLPYTKRGGRYFFRRARLDQWFDADETVTTTPTVATVRRKPRIHL